MEPSPRRADLRNPSTLALPVADLCPEPDEPALLDLHELLRGDLMLVESSPPRRRAYSGETPIDGQGAVARWLALHDCARDLRSALRPGDGVGKRTARRAIRSLFLYEHQLTAKARRQARTALWRRDRTEPLPAFAERARWSRCRCHDCQPVLHAERAAMTMTPTVEKALPLGA